MSPEPSTHPAQPVQPQQVLASRNTPSTVGDDDTEDCMVVKEPVHVDSRVVWQAPATSNHAASLPRKQFLSRRSPIAPKSRCRGWIMTSWLVDAITMRPGSGITQHSSHPNCIAGLHPCCTPLHLIPGEFSNPPGTRSSRLILLTAILFPIGQNFPSPRNIARSPHTGLV